MEIAVAFGKSGLKLDLPEGPNYQVINVHDAVPVDDAPAAIVNALKNPIGSPALAELARGRKSAAISVCDITRPAPNRVTLPPLLAELQRAGIVREDITILIATGLHRPATPEELDTILGPEIAATYRIVNHDARSTEDNRFIGTTKRGTPVYIDRGLLDADLHITLGFIEQHLMLGFSGGRKLVAPGVAGQETIKTIHSPRFMRESLATEGSIENNPLHAELLEIAAMAGHHFMLDVTLDKARNITGIFAGDPVQAHAAGVNFLRSSSLKELPGLVDAVITSAAGYPLDMTFYQTVKGVTAVQHFVKPGGKILIVSECQEGVGSPEFANKVRGYKGPQEFLDEIANTPVEIDQWQLEKLAMVSLRNPVSFYVPGIPSAELGGMAQNAFSTAAAAIANLLEGLPAGATVAVVPDGPYAYARAKSE
ncbi:nickel-dependent lactate racemase [Silvibacterium acidisoli]|uniref:nickel-dependent lactate racemase n=1 Tax=Acidobacteriaceae bacterium ZG23-2 TaxID=2883246 RepID=UPI00406C5457